MSVRFSIPYSNPRWWWAGDYTPACFECTHFWGAVKGLPRCKAFPDGIPRELMGRNVKHDKAYPNDQGIQFEQYTEI